MEITLESISKTYVGSGGNTPAVSDIFLNIASGEFFFLLGPSGCGKTTLLRMIAGLVNPSRGKILFDGHDVTNLPVEKRNTAMVFQGYALWPHMTVLENVEFGPRMKRMAKKSRIRTAHDQLKRVEMTAMSRRKPSQLSGGQQQRVALARALAAQSDCLLLDEPLSNLDARLRLHMREELREIVKTSGMTAVYVTHDQKEALSMADRLAVMDSGRIVQVGTPQHIYGRPETRFVADFLGDANFIDGHVIEAGSFLGIETPSGVLRAAASKDMKAGDGITCCVRPEQLRLIPCEQGRPCASVTVLDATILGAVYLGDTYQYRCRLHGKEEIIWKVAVFSHEGQIYEEGRNVSILVFPEKVSLIKRRSTGSAREL